MGTDHKRALHVGKPHLKMLALLKASYGFLNLTDPSLGQDCWTSRACAKVSYLYWSENAQPKPD